MAESPIDMVRKMIDLSSITNPAVTRLTKASNIWDLRAIAKRRTPKGPFDYTDGAAEDEVTLQVSTGKVPDPPPAPGNN